MRLYGPNGCSTFVPVDWQGLNSYPIIQISNRNTNSSNYPEEPCLCLFCPCRSTFKIKSRLPDPVEFLITCLVHHKSKMVIINILQKVSANFQAFRYVKIPTIYLSFVQTRR